MPSHRTERVSDDIRRVLAEKLRQVKDPRVCQGEMLSVTRVVTSGDLRVCRVYISALGEHDPRELERGLRSVAGWLRRELGATLALKYTPELRFVLDDSIAHGAYMTELIDRLENRLEREHEDDNDP